MVKVLFANQKEYIDKVTNVRTAYVELTLVDEVEQKVARVKVYNEDAIKTPFKVGEDVDLVGYIKYDGNLGVKVCHKKGGN